jgi:predicted phage terminase large subunit-like protein
MLRGPFTEDLESQLQQFYHDFIAGKRPQLALMAPPQHGKSWAAEDFIAWVAGNNPDLKIMYASYSTELGTRCNLNLQRRMMSDRYREVFPNTIVGAPGWACNSDLIEFAQHAESFRNTTVEGQINGLELHLGVLDDPMKGRAEANSPTHRDRLWTWFTDDWGPRFAANSAMLIIMTRWHPDDLLGRFIDRVPDVKVLPYPAIAEESEGYRCAGEALKPLDFLQRQKKLLSQASWQSLYQQNPIVVGGGMFPIEKLSLLTLWDRKSIKRSCRYWDKACTVNEHGAYSAGVLMHMLHDNRFVIEHVARGRWSASEREQKILFWAKQDRASLKGPYEIGVEQEPGSGGKESAEATLRMLRGFRAFADRVTGKKELRAEPIAAQVQAGNVYLVAGEWNRRFVDEAETWPSGRWKDQIDAAAGAIARLVHGPQTNWRAALGME